MQHRLALTVKSGLFSTLSYRGFFAIVVYVCVCFLCIVNAVGSYGYRIQDFNARFNASYQRRTFLSRYVCFC